MGTGTGTVDTEGKGANWVGAPEWDIGIETEAERSPSNSFIHLHHTPPVVGF